MQRDRSDANGPTGETSPPDSRRARGFLFAAVALAALAYGAAAHGGYVFDDVPAIRDNPALQQGDWWGAAFAHASPLGNRPLATLTLVLDAKLFDDACFGQHLGNVLLHLLATALAFAVVRAALRTGDLEGRIPSARATFVAFATAAVWAVHPLCADAVAYATQRSTMLMAVFALAALLATLRAETARSPFAWRATAVAAVAAAVLAKEDAVVLPLLLCFFVRAFLARGHGGMRRFAPFLLAVASTWILLAALVAFGPHNPTVGYATRPPCTAIEWLQTQAGFVVHYLQLALVPIGQRGCYDGPIVRTLAPALLPGAAILLLLVATFWATARRPRLGFLFLWVFLWLSPTSTVLPIVTELAAERRMFLPLLAIAVGFAFGVDALATRVAFRPARWLLLAPVLATLVLASWNRVAVHRDEVAFWTDAFERREPASRSHTSGILLANYARIVRQRGEREAARDLFALAASCEAPPAAVLLHHATILVELDDEARARDVLQRLAVDTPQLGDELHARAQERFAACRRTPDGAPVPSDPDLAAAVLFARMAALHEPTRAGFQNTLATLLACEGRIDAAIAAYRTALALDPEALPVYGNLGDLLLSAGRAREAVPVVRQLLARRPLDVDLRLGVAETFLRQRELAFVRSVLDDVLRLQPANERARAIGRELDALERR